MNTLDTDCKMNTLDTDCEMNTLDTDCKMNTLDTACEMNTLDTDCKMNTLDTDCKMNTLDTACEMNTLDTACEMNTQDTVCEMKPLDTVIKLKTLETTCDINSLKTVDETVVKTLDMACEMKTSDTACSETNSSEIIDNHKVITDSMDTTAGSICPLKRTREMVEDKYNDSVNKTEKKGADEIVCSELVNPTEKVASNSNKVVDNLESISSVNDGGKTLADESACQIRETVKRVAADGVNNEPVCKKAKSESIESAENSDKMLSQAGDVLEEKTKNTPKEDTGEAPADALNQAVNVTAGFHEPSDGALCMGDKAGLEEKMSPLTEIQAGITEYIGSHKGFSAVIKQRYSDFIVNEIDVQGNVVHLTQMEPPEILSQEANAECGQNGEITSDIVSDEDITKLEILAKSENKKAVVNIVAPSDKDLRTKIHLAVKKRYSQLETKTADVDGQKMIQVMWKTGKSRDRNKDDWPESKKDFKYVKFVLYKENKDTMDAIGLIAKNLKVRENLFQYAGTKDKRAKTSQEITTHRIHPKKLSFLNKVLWNMGLGNFQYVKEPLKLGQLSGNQFTIVLRNVQGSSETINHAITSLKTSGFVNYFGMQRFGTTLVPTHKVGCALLHGDWERAVDLILMPREDNPSKDAFQKVWMDTRDPEATLKATPRYCGLERNLLEALKKKMKPFNALEKISRNTRLLYIHSYQALIWNQMVSKRLKLFGFKPIIGDLVQPDGSDSSERSSPILITQDNLDQFSLHHVVLPLPGHDVMYPNNEVHTWYREMLVADGLDIDNMKRQQKDYSLPGAYRRMTVCPSYVSWSQHHYDDYSLALTLSDMELIKGVSLPVSQNKGKFKAVVLKMNLPSSSYATMALREVLRVDTSAAHQTSLNVT